MRLLLAALLALIVPAHAADVAKPSVITPAALETAAPPQRLAVPALPTAALPAIPALPASMVTAVAVPVQTAAVVPAAAVSASPAASAARDISALERKSQVDSTTALTASARSVESALQTTQRVAEATAKPGRFDGVSAAVFDGRSSRGAAVFVAPKTRSSSDETAGLSGKELLAKLHDVSGRGYHAHDYDEAHKFLFGTADQVVVNGQHGVIDAYSGVFEPGTSSDGGQYGEHGDQNHDGRIDTGMNVEHVWPQSFFDKRLPMRSDLHHLMATFVYPNGVRGNLPFGEVRGGGDYSNDAGAKRGQGVFEPPNAVKGRVARALLYFYTRYYDRNITNGAFGDSFWNSKLEMILRWNRQFPPTDFEKRRNDVVEQYQGNRNPFVDDFTLADRIGLDALKRVPALQYHERESFKKRQRRNSGGR